MPQCEITLTHEYAVPWELVVMAYIDKMENHADADVVRRNVRLWRIGAPPFELRTLARQVLCAEPLVRLVAELLGATNPHREDNSNDTSRLVRYGASPRAGQSILLAAKVTAALNQRASVSREDLRAPMLAALQHRVVLSFEADAEGITVADLLANWCSLAEQRAGI